MFHKHLLFSKSINSSYDSDSSKTHNLFFTKIYRLANLSIFFGDFDLGKTYALSPMEIHRLVYLLIPHMIQILVRLTAYYQ